jgi:hypothetical protein
MAAAGANNEGENVPGPENILDSFVSMKKSCLMYADRGKGYYVKVSVPESNRAAVASQARFQAAVRAFTKLHGVDTFKDAPNGIYTWILSDAGFLAARVLSLFELGTLHKQLAGFLGAKRVFVAGECNKQGDTVAINLQSGTFTLKILERVRETNATITDRLKERARGVFEGMGFEGVKVSVLGDKTLIRENTTPVLKDELELYKAAGFVVELYNKKEDCNGSALSGLMAHHSRLVALIAQKEREVEEFQRRTEKGNATAKILKAAPAQLAEAKAELPTVEGQIAKIEEEIAGRKRVLGGGRRAHPLGEQALRAERARRQRRQTRKRRS